MKKNFYFYGIIGIILVQCLVSIGCDNGNNSKVDGGNQFKGTWSWTGTGSITENGTTMTFTSMTIVFDDNTYEQTALITSPLSATVKNRGDYAFDGTSGWLTQVETSISSQNNGAWYSNPEGPDTLTITDGNKIVASETITLTKQ
jgi:hypothetical protein